MQPSAGKKGKTLAAKQPTFNINFFQQKKSMEKETRE